MYCIAIAIATHTSTRTTASKDKGDHASHIHIGNTQAHLNDYGAWETRFLDRKPKRYAG